MTLLAREMSMIVWWLVHSLALPFLGIGMRTDLFQSCGHWWVFQICWHIECNTFMASSFRVLNSSTGISLHPLALLTAVLLKALLLLLSRFSLIRLCATPQTVAHQAPPSLGFSRQEHWSGLPFPSPMHESESEVAQWCPTPSNPMDCSLPGPSIHGIFQGGVLEWVDLILRLSGPGWLTTPS